MCGPNTAHVNVSVQVCMVMDTADVAIYTLSPIEHSYEQRWVNQFKLFIHIHTAYT